MLRRQSRKPALTPEDADHIAAGILSGKLGFANEARSSVLSVAVTTRDPALSARIANEVAKQFLDFKRQEKFAAMQRAHDWFQEQMGQPRGAAERRRPARSSITACSTGWTSCRRTTATVSRAETVNRQQLNAISHQLSEVVRESRAQAGSARAGAGGDARRSAP